MYKVVVDMMERYYLEFESPLYKRYKKQLIPFAIRFYKILNKSNLDYIGLYVNHMKASYNKFVSFESKEEYIDYYEKQLMDLDNLSRATGPLDCLL